MKASGHINGQLFGYRELPEKSGLWGVLLPKPGERSVAHEPNAQNIFERIDGKTMVFATPDHVGNRGFLFALCTPTAALCIPMPFITLAWVGEHPWWVILPFTIVGLLFFIPLAITSYKSARKPLLPPVIVHHDEQKIYFWLHREGEWLGVDYSNLTAATFVRRTASSSGAITTYVLTLCQLKPGTRQIEYAIVPAPAQATPQACGELWEFIRRYMDGDADALPPVRLVPPIDHPKAWMARTDRTVFAGQIDEQHRIKRDWFSMAVVWFWGSVGYWWERAAGWIERTAPRHPLPPELQGLCAAVTDNPLRVIPPSPVEQQARAGTLPHMRRRWFICGVIGTAIWGTLFGLIAAGIWLMR